MPTEDSNIEPGRGRDAASLEYTLQHCVCHTMSSRQGKDCRY